MIPNYCLKCGHELETRNISNVDRRACPACDFVFWGDYSIGVGAIVIKDDKILLVRRAQEPGRGRFTLPGGYIEQFEPIEETVIREVKEETGVIAKVSSVVALRDQPRAVHNIYVVFAMDYVSGDVLPDNEEVDQAGFYSLEDMTSMNVADLTRWLVHIAYSKTRSGLQPDPAPIVPLQGYGLYRV